MPERRPATLGSQLFVRLPADPNVLAPLRVALRRWLGRSSANDSEAFEILVATGEACANAIRHAGGPGSTFEIEGTLDGGVSVRVRDNGRWRSPRPTDGGRGLFIMKSLMDEVQISKSADGTEVRMYRGLRRPGRRSAAQET